MGSSSESADMSEEADDWESLWLLCGVDARVDDDVVEAELMLCVVWCRAVTFLIAGDEAIEARETVASPEIGTRGEASGEGEDGADSVTERSRPAASRRAPSLRAALAVGMIADTAAAGVDGEGVPGTEYARSIPRLTILSHFRLS